MIELKLGELSAAWWADVKKKNKHAIKGDSEYETAGERAQQAKAQ